MVRVAEKTASLELIAAPAIEKRIFVVRGRQVMLDEDLADLYGVETKRLVEQVKRNVERFPADFMFQLDEAEAAALRSQIATSKTGRGGRRYAPYVFTEQGVAMLSGVLRSKRAIAVNVEIMRAFVELRRAAASYSALEERLRELERSLTKRPTRCSARWTPRSRRPASGPGRREPYPRRGLAVRAVRPQTAAGIASRKALLTQRIAKLGPEKMDEVCQALRTATSC